MKIIAICGSTKSTSLNLSLIKATETLLQGICEVEIFSSIDKLPHFNPDLDNEKPPQEVVDYRTKLRSADGILICTPEYAMGVPGSLKNALDWTVSSCEFSKKPVALITASSQGQKGHRALMETLNIIESDISESTQLIISFVKTKVSSDNFIKDEATEKEVKSLLDALIEKIKSKRE